MFKKIDNTNEDKIFYTHVDRFHKMIIKLNNPSSLIIQKTKLSNMIVIEYDQGFQLSSEIDYYNNKVRKTTLYIEETLQNGKCKIAIPEGFTCNFELQING
jgi:hypothetical protein